MSKIRYLNFDPGFTTGYAEFDLVDNNIVSIDLAPLKLGKRSKVDVLSKYQDFVFQRISRANNEADDVVVTIEDYVGGTGGNVQNFVNQVIGTIIGSTLSVAEELIIDIQVNKFINRSRLPYLKYAKDVTPRGTSNHSIDALAHGLHAVSLLVPLERLLWHGSKLAPELKDVSAVTKTA